VGATGQMDDALVSEFLTHFAAEWPGRWLQSPNSRDCGTRLSNLDLAGAMSSIPATVVRFWAGHASDVLRGNVGNCMPTSLPDEIADSANEN